MLESLFGSQTKEFILLFLLHYGEITAPDISKGTGKSITSIVNHLSKLELGGIVISRLIGKARLYKFNDKSPFIEPLKQMITIIYSRISIKEKEQLFSLRLSPRRKGKPLK